MKSYTLRHQVWLPRPRSEVFAFFSQAENLEQLTPPWLRFQIVTPRPIQLREGATIEYALRLRGIPVRWLTVIERWDPPNEFTDVQIKGPYRLWRHTHRFTESGGGTQMEDIIEYALPLGILGQIVNRVQVSRDLAKIFAYREQQVRELFR